MMRLHKAICSCGGIGYLKGGGTYAALFFVLIRYFTRGTWNNVVGELLVFGVVFGLGVWSAFQVEHDWGKDSSKVVIDEVAGMSFTLLFVPPTLVNVIIGFGLFRFFDIAKPFYLRRLERFPGGWGVMLDDLGAGLFAHGVLSIMIASLLT